MISENARPDAKEPRRGGDSAGFFKGREILGEDDSQLRYTWYHLGSHCTKLCGQKEDEIL